MKLFSRDSGRKRLTALGMVLLLVFVLIGLKLLADTVASKTMPHRSAMAHHCRADQDDQDGVFFANMCERDINLRYCIYVDDATEPSVCKTTLLAPGEGVTDYISDRMSVKAEAGQGADISRVEVWSCYAPFEPGMIENLNKRTIMQQGCLPLDEDAEQ